jgi:sulfur carrier protein ThiS adenylyltransferase
MDRAIRQRDLVPPAALGQYHTAIVGVGAIGRQVALQLAAMGAAVLSIYDHDHVGTENLAVQGYRHEDLERAKSLATAEACRQLNPSVLLDAQVLRFTRSTEIVLRRPKLAVFACVDAMSARKIVWQATHAKAAFFADGRMAGEVLRVLASADPPVDTRYPQTLFEDAAAFPAPCTGRSTLYAASIAAGLMLARFAQHLRGQEPARDVLLNLAADELSVF